MRRIGPLPGAAIALTLGSAGVAAAQGAAPSVETVRLRAGEHAGFSRVAVDLPGLAGWELRREDRRVILDFPGRRTAFDGRQIFPERRVSRVTGARGDLDEAGSRLTLQLSCDCDARAYEFRPGMLVLDIGPAAAPAPAAVDVGPPPRRPDAAVPVAEAPSAVDAAPERLSVEEARERLLQQLARAADQGLVAFREPSAAPSEAGEAPDATDVAPPPAAGTPDGDAAAAAARPDAGTTPPSTAVEAPVVQLDARTAYDREGQRPRRIRPEPCPEDALLAADTWAAEEDDFGEALATRRRALVAEFDRPATDAALAVARLYILHGFGAEARQVLAEFAADAGETPLLADLAALADDDPAAPDGPLARAAACGGRVALWRIAAGFAPPPETVAQPGWVGSVLEAFEEAPLALRRRAGPDLLTRLVDLGLPAEAEAARLLLDRAPGDHGDRWRLASARLAMAVGEGGAAERLLNAVIAGDGPEAPEALLALADLISARDGRLPEDLVEALGLAAFRLQGSDLGRRLLVAEVLGRAGRDQLGAALETLALQRAAGRVGPEDFDAALRAILDVARAADVGAAAYAAAVLTHALLIGRDAAWDRTRARVAAELTGIGLANAARDLVAPAVERGDAAVRVAAARAETALGLPDAALRLLEGAGDREAALARAEALAALGRHAEAHREAAPHLDAKARAELAWRAGAWAAATALPAEDPRHRLAAWMAARGDGEGAAPPLPPPDAPLGPEVLGPEPSLSVARTAVEAARDARALIEKALQDG